MATKTKENVKGIKAIQDLFLQGKKEVKKSEIDSLGFDTSLKKFEKDLLFEKYYISVVDKLKDLDGNLINENTKLIHRIHTLWEAGKREIPFKDLFDLNIPAISFVFGASRLMSSTTTIAF